MGAFASGLLGAMKTMASSWYSCRSGAAWSKTLISAALWSITASTFSTAALSSSAASSGSPAGLVDAVASSATGGMAATTTGSPASGLGVMSSQVPPARKTATSVMAARANRLGRRDSRRSLRLRFRKGVRSSSCSIFRASVSA
jgi:lysozyme family protein